MREMASIDEDPQPSRRGWHGEALATDKEYEWLLDRLRAQQTPEDIARDLLAIEQQETQQIILLRTKEMPVVTARKNWFGRVAMRLASAVGAIR